MSGPVIVGPNPASYFIKPGLHSHNTKRRLQRSSPVLAVVGRIRVLLLFLGLCGIGFYCYSLSDQYVYQAYQNWAFDQQIAGRSAVTCADYLRERTPFGFLVGPKASTPRVSATPPPAHASTPELIRPAEGALLGRVEIERLNLSAIVREGADAKTLSTAVGHVPSTALPGQTGNFAIAAHRDTLFRALKDIRKGDQVTFQSPTGTFSYQVFSTKIVRPSDISVLQPDGGDANPSAGSTSSTSAPGKLLTMITCYPFYYVGSAPKRFIVQASLVSADRGTSLPSPQAPDRRLAKDIVSGGAPARVAAKHKIVKPPSATNRPPKKRHFLSKFFHAG